MAKAMKNPVRKGPVIVSLPVKYKNRKIARQINAKAINILEMMLFFIIRVFKSVKSMKIKESLLKVPNF